MSSSGDVRGRSDHQCCRFQSEHTKCLEYARDPDKAAAENEDAAKRKPHSVTFSEAECKVREFVPEKELVTDKEFLWGVSKLAEPNLIS